MRKSFFLSSSPFGRTFPRWSAVGARPHPIGPEQHQEVSPDWTAHHNPGSPCFSEALCGDPQAGGRHVVMETTEAPGGHRSAERQRGATPPHPPFAQRQLHRSGRQTRPTRTEWAPIFLKLSFCESQNLKVGERERSSSAEL